MQNKQIEKKVIIKWSCGEDGPLEDTLTIQGVNTDPKEKVVALFTALGKTILHEIPEGDARITATAICCEHLLGYIREGTRDAEPEDRLAELTMQLAVWMVENTKAETPEEVRRMCQKHAEVLEEVCQMCAEILERAEQGLEAAEILKRAEEADEL